MKIIIFSDSHRALGGMVEAIELEKPDQVIHLGDLERDADYLREKFPLIPICGVPGNCDYSSRDDFTKLVTISGKQIFLNHGHTYHVKYGYEAIINAACLRKADFLLFGHTHVPYYSEAYGLVIINPGSIRDSGTYGLLEIEKSNYRYKLKNTNDIPL